MLQTTNLRDERIDLAGMIFINLITTHYLGLKRGSCKRGPNWLINERFKVDYLWKIWSAGVDPAALSP